MMSTPNADLEVVIIDDDKAILFLHDLMVKQSAISKQIMKFLNGRDALAYLKSLSTDHPPCLIFLDINMPEMNGWQFLELLEVSGLQDRIYVVMITSSIQKSDREKAKKFASVVHYIEKPLSLVRIAELQQIGRISHLFTAKEKQA